ncbi:hypothetical protein MKW98_026701 [Papaver atlanticum]|uniref:DUF3444 domain-containing protein n=1 Tax=Papaver atlanticum TaxID=357466 RepID=A0AAD4S059_9MAGN|nr:hypothetical protein MKW98_026701 [Papaver atlanticum]
MNITQSKIEKDLQMQPPPGFSTKVYPRKGLTNTESKPSTDRGKEDASNTKEDENSDSSNSDAEEVAAEDEDHYEQEPEPAVIEVFPDPDFYDFERDRSEESFAADQIWAIYDYMEGMPRYYVQIDEVFSPFKVDITWLEFVAGDINETAWKRSRLPVACGKFKLGKTGTIESIHSFSHKIFWDKGVSMCLNIYPRKGETWALYKNWSIKWSSDPNNHREYEYEFVVVLSDYSKKSGSSVAHLVKLKGFVCLFKPTKNNGMASFQIPSSEMLRFSHRVPSFRTNGKEREDVPEGYFEFAPSCLPSNLEEVSGGFIDIEAENVNVINGSLGSVSKEKHPMLKKRKNPDVEGTLGRSAPGGNKSSRVIDIPGNVDEDISSSSSLKVFKMLDTEFCNFNKERSFEKFKTGQIWALYCKLDQLHRYRRKLDKFPKSYAWIESVEAFPVLIVAVKWLKSCDPPRGIIPWADKEIPVNCGTFKISSSEVVVFYDSISFSHQLSEVAAVNNVYTIYPRAGEVWAVYSKFRPDLVCSDLTNCKYDFVEILEVVDVHWIIVSVLERVTGFKTVFKAKEKEGLDSTVAIPWIELYRFSHQVPNFVLSGARYGKLRGCRELDPRSLAVY